MNSINKIMPNILAVHGLIGAGKDTTISFIKTHLLLQKKFMQSGNITSISGWVDNAIKEKDNHNWKVDELNIAIERFAKPLKTFICGLLGCTEEQLNSQEFKNQQLPEIFYSRKLGRVPTIRELHTVPSDALKEILNPDVLGASCLSRSRDLLNAGKDMVIINDLRYEDLELPYCIKYNAYLIKVTRVDSEKKRDVFKHSSEMGIPSEKFDFIIRNDTTYIDLFKMVLNMLFDGGFVNYDYKKFVDSLNI